MEETTVEDQYSKRPKETSEHTYESNARFSIWIIMCVWRCLCGMLKTRVVVGSATPLVGYVRCSL